MRLLLPALLLLAPALAAAADPAPVPAAVPAPLAVPPPPASPGPEAVATFECLGLSWAPPEGAADNPCAARYRAEGETAWREALPPWFDVRNGEYRGSIVGLRPGTNYEVSLRLEKGTSATLSGRTWSEAFPVARTVTLPAGTTAQPLTITEGGTPQGYVVYTAPPGAAIDVANQADACVVVAAPYVIVRGLTLRGARCDGIQLRDGGMHDVVIERCDVSGWGRIADDGWGVNLDAGVQCRKPGVTRVVVQRCLFHDPRSNSNDWTQPRPATHEKNPNHPEGPQAVCFFNTGGNIVLRYNEVWSDEEHRFNDGMGGNENFSFRGFPGRDSDVYGNIIRNACDDGLEMEGSDRNVRVWGNYLDHTATGVSSAAVSIGPLYIFRNVYAVSRWHAGGDEEAGNHGIFGKIGDDNGYGGGRRYLFHNTLLQPPRGEVRTGGASHGAGDSAGPVTNTVSRNNLWHVSAGPAAAPGWGVSDRKGNPPNNDFDYDLSNGEFRLEAGQEAHRVAGVPVYAPGNGPETFPDSGGPIRPSGRYALAPDSPGAKAGTPLPNFNRGDAAHPPDLGAQEPDGPPMEFGVHAGETGAP